MKISKRFSIIFQSIQGLLILGFILSLFNWDRLNVGHISWDWLKVDYIAIAVITMFWIFLNIVSWWSILMPERRPINAEDTYK